MIAIFILLTVLPHFFVEIVGHRMTVDLSYTIDSKVMKWLTAKEFEIKITNGTKTLGNNASNIWYQSEEISLATHTGTHLDAPIHFGKNRWTVAQIPLQNLVEKPLAIIDIVEQCQASRDYRATVEDIKQYEANNGEIHEESVVIFRTGWSRFWPSKLDYFGTETTDESQAHFPGLDSKAARWLIKNRKVVGVGIDGPSMDCGQCSLKPAHVTLSNSNIFILENIEKSIFKVPVVGATLTVMPLKLAEASGSPARVLAQFSHNHAETNLAIVTQPSHLIWPLLLASIFVCLKNLN